MKQENVKKKA